MREGIYHDARSLVQVIKDINGRHLTRYPLVLNGRQAIDLPEEFMRETAFGGRLEAVQILQRAGRPMYQVVEPREGIEVRVDRNMVFGVSSRLMETDTWYVRVLGGEEFYVPNRFDWTIQAACEQAVGFYKLRSPAIFEAYWRVKDEPALKTVMCMGTFGSLVQAVRAML